MNTCRPREFLKPNAPIILEHLQILEVEKVKRSLTLGTQTKEIDTVICSKHLDTKPVIYITKSVTELALASELATILLLKKGKEDTLKFFAILQTSIESLRQQGYPIDRLLPDHMTEEKNIKKMMEEDKQAAKTATQTSGSSYGVVSNSNSNGNGEKVTTVTKSSRSKTVTSLPVESTLSSLLSQVIQVVWS